MSDGLTPFSGSNHHSSDLLSLINPTSSKTEGSLWTRTWFAVVTPYIQSIIVVGNSLANTIFVAEGFRADLD